MTVSPDLLTFQDGSAVDAGGWARRRQELYDAIIPHEYGGLPPRGEGVEVVRRAQSRVRAWPGVRYFTYEIRAHFAGAGEVPMTLSVWRPPGDGPFPVVLDADGCWRTFNDQVVQQVLARGNIAASFDRTQAAADNKDAYRQTGLYRLFPEAAFGVLAAWAWGCRRCIDALLEMPDVRADGIALTGHSRGGKTVLLAGATDDRIAVTNPNDAGIGGAGLNRLKASGSETVESFYRSGNIFWFGQGFGDYRHRDGQMPYDQHYLLALVAPRLLLITDAYEDAGANPAGAHAACRAAVEVYRMLGRPEAIGWSVREGGHAHTPSDYEALLDYLDMHVHQRPVQRDFQRRLFANIDELLTAQLG